MQKLLHKCESCNALFEKKGDLFQHLDENPDHKRLLKSQKGQSTHEKSTSLSSPSKVSQSSTKKKVEKEHHSTKDVVSFQKSSVTKIVKMTTTTEALQTVKYKERQKLVFSLVQDASGSMAGSRMRTSLAGFDFMFTDVMRPDDFLGVVTFNSSVNTLHQPMLVKKVNKEMDMENIQKSVGGGTAAYDALGSAICELKRMKDDEKYASVTNDAVYQMLLVTDGEDNASTKYTLNTLSELVAKPGLPNFHLFVIAVKMLPPDKAKLEKLCKPDHCTFYEVEELDKLAEMLVKVGERVLERLVCVKTTETIIQSDLTLSDPSKLIRLISSSKPSSSVKTITNTNGKPLPRQRSPDTVTATVSAVSTPPQVVEKKLVKLLKKHPTGIMGAQIGNFYKEEYGFPLQLGERKLKDVLLGTGCVKVIGGDGPGDKMFQFNK